jgi:hypothetical protein
MIRGELAIGAHFRAAHLYAVGSFDPDHDAVMRIGVGLQPTGLTRGEAPGGGPILSVGIRAMFEYGFPPPRIVNRQSALNASARAEYGENAVPGALSLLDAG